MQFTKEFMQECVLYEDDGVEIIRDDIVDTSRWSEIHEIVFKYEGKFYASGYSCGLTEYQDENPWEYDDDLIECFEVEPYEATVIKYRKVKGG